MTDLDAVRAAAPDDMPWLCFTSTGHGFWQPTRGHGDMWWSTYSRMSDMHSSELALSAIHLPTGTVHIQQPDGSIVEVTQSEWDV
jgi:hypothetical protein